MKCKKCGAGIPAGYVYCAACGSEVQLVPDYNLLDDEMLSDIVQLESGEADDGAKAETRGGKKKGAHSKSAAVWKIICVVIAAAIVTFFFMCGSIQKKQKNSYAYQYQKAEECFAAKKWDEATGYYKRSLELKPHDRKAKERLCDTRLALHDDKGAIEILEKLFSEDKKNLACIEKLVELYDRNGEYDKILALSKEAGGSGADLLFADYLVAPPEFDRVSGTYSEELRVEIVTDGRQEVFYTTDGSDPVQNGVPYEGEISLSEGGTTVILAVARNERGFYSEVAKASYTIQYQPPDMPKVTPAGGTYADSQMITVQAPDNCKVYYTWDGSDPTEGSPVYTGPLEMPQGNQVLSVMAVSASGLKSGIYRVNYIYMP